MAGNALDDLERLGKRDKGKAGILARGLAYVVRMLEAGQVQPAAVEHVEREDLDDLEAPRPPDPRRDADKVAFEAGRAAGRRGGPLSDNPFPRTDRRWKRWTAGWTLGAEERAKGVTPRTPQAAHNRKARAASARDEAGVVDAPDFPDPVADKHAGAERKGWFAAWAGHGEDACPYGDGKGASGFRRRWLKGHTRGLEARKARASA